MFRLLEVIIWKVSVHHKQVYLYTNYSESDGTGGLKLYVRIEEKPTSSISWFIV